MSLVKYITIYRFIRKGQGRKGRRSGEGGRGGKKEEGKGGVKVDVGGQGHLS